MAIVGGANLILDHGPMIALSKLRYTYFALFRIAVLICTDFCRPMGVVLHMTRERTALAAAKVQVVLC